MPTTDQGPTSDGLATLAHGGLLTEDAAFGLFSRLLGGELDDAQIGAVLAAIAVRDPSVSELVGAARAMRERVTRVPFEPGAGDALIDTCGTGGAAKTFRKPDRRKIITRVNGYHGVTVCASSMTGKPYNEHFG
ncbi:MAG: hypothetical protein AAF235_11860, partial [Planctomycetota bacterium]